MSTIGYGDIVPSTVTEKIYGVIISFLTCGVFAFAINMTGTFYNGSLSYFIIYSFKKGTIFQEKVII